jgi:UDP-3-O-[3-hydroxymyristoyl] glucosamine N-acyltransferase
LSGHGDQKNPGQHRGSELVQIAHNAAIGANVRIGDGSIVGVEGAAAVTIGDRTTIGRKVVVEPGVVIGSDAIIGDRCTIAVGCRIADGTAIADDMHINGDGLGADDATLGSSSPSASPVTRSIRPISPHALIASNVVLGEGVEIGPFAIVGWDGEEPTYIGSGTKIAPYALIEPGVAIGKNCDVDAYCRVGFGSRIDDECKLLYGAAVFENVTIGRACIVGGDVADRTVLEDYVTFFGEVAHEYRHPGDLADWDGKPSESPIIRTRSIVAQNAIIVGGRKIGPSSYIAAGEVVNVDVPPGMLFQRGQMVEISKTRGLVQTRRDGLEK